MAELLRELTLGFEVTTCGVSAGGYAAVLFAHLIHAERFFTISGQFSIWHEMKAPFIYENASCPEKSVYYDISKFIQSGGGGYYLWPAKSEQDKIQHEFVKDSSYVLSLSFNSKKHGGPFPSYCYPYILTRSNTELHSILNKMNRIMNTPLNSHIFAFRMMPIGVILYAIAQKLVNKILKKLHFQR